ncbi:unnamed protein product [Brassica oleracea]
MTNRSGSCSTSSGWTRVRTHGIPIRCSCGEGVIELISKSDPNPYHRYYQCCYAAQRKLVIENHVFEWVDEAFTDKIKHLDNQVRVLEEELKLIKATMRIERPNNGWMLFISFPFLSFPSLSQGFSVHPSLLSHHELRSKNSRHGSMGKKMNKREKKKIKEHFDMIGYVTDAYYGIPSRFPCGERVINEVSPKPKYPTDFDIFMGVDTSHARTSRTMASTFINQGLSVSRKRIRRKNEKRHVAEIEKYSISDQIRLLDEIMEKGLSYFNIKEEKDRIEVNILFAEEKLRTIKVMYIYWEKLGESFISKP